MTREQAQPSHVPRNFIRPMAIDHFTLTVHADERLPQRGLTRARVENALRQLHPIRETNEGTAQWRVDAGGFVIVYVHPDGDDVSSVRIVSVWTKRRRKRRVSGGYSQ
jgi:hypothetical protein